MGWLQTIGVTPLARRDRDAASVAAIVQRMDSRPALIEFPADDPGRARRFWGELLGVELDERPTHEGQGWQTHTDTTAVGVHARGTGPGDTVSLPYFTVADIDASLERVKALGGSVVHPGSQWAICRDSEGSPFGLALHATFDTTP
jgi:predicted enzyme related to lactoylglutathione lyase